MTTLADLEKAAENIVEGVIDHEGLINTIAGAVGILPEVALAEKVLPLIAGALQFLQGTGGMTLMQAFEALVSHVTPGQPNAPVLNGPTDQQATTT